MEAITSTTEDHLKAIWSAREWGGAAITVKGLAARFGTSAAAASNTVKRLVGQGLLIHDPYGPIELTPAGERQAVMMVRRHRLIETFLVETLGYTWNEVHDEAEVLEHAASDLLMGRIDDLLGNPLVDPHGDPIPTASGCVTYPAGARRASAAEAGRYGVARISDESSKLLEWFESHGIRTGQELTVIGRDGTGTEIVIGTKKVRLSCEAGDSLLVVPN